MIGIFTIHYFAYNTMSKDSSDSLFLLIHRMSKSEKRFFKLMASRQEKGDGKFIRLFDRLEKMKTYNEETLLKLEPSLSRRQLPNQKAFLADYLLRCLTLCNSADLPDLRLNEMVSAARILYEKCLYRDCIRMIDKAKKAALKQERPVQLLELLQLESLVTRHSVRAHHAERVLETVERSQKLLKQLDTANRFRNLSIRLNTFYVQSGFIRNKQELEKVARFFRKNLPAYDEKKLDFTEKLQLYYALTGYYFFIQDFTNGYRYARRWVALFEQRPEMIRDYTEMYIQALNSLLVVQNKLGMLREFEQVHRMLVSLKRSSPRPLTENENLNLFKAIYIHELNRHFMRGEFRSGIRIVARLEGELNRFIPLLDHHSLLLFYYKIACLYFGADQFKRALFWLNRIILQKDISVREDLHGFARILALICHFELGNDRLAEAHIISLYRFLLRKGKISAYHQLILDFLRKLHRNVSPRELDKLFRGLKEKLLPLSRLRFEKKSFYYFDIITWLESRIEKRTMEQVIKEKAMLKLTAV